MEDIYNDLVSKDKKKKFRNLRKTKYLKPTAEAQFYCFWHSGVQVKLQ